MHAAPRPHEPAAPPPAAAPEPAGATRLHDVLIVGGGLVGASLAIALDGAGVDVALVEATAPGALPAVFDERNLSFSEATVNALQALGVMALLRTGGGPIRRIHVSRRGDFGRAVFDAARHGRDEFGRVVVARDFGDALERRLAGLERLVRYRPARFTGLVEHARDHRAVSVESDAGPQTVRARLLVGADGARSPVRAALGIGADEHDYRQTLFVARIQTDRGADGTAYERLGEHGPAALLPRGDGHYGFVLAVPAAQVDEVAALDERGFLDLAQSAFGWRAGRFIACGARSAYPATKVLAREVHGERCVLVGNAAQSIHPLGAQGFNLGLRDALVLAEEVAAARAGGTAADCGAPELLQRYQARRSEDRARTIAFSDGLARLSSNPGSLASGLRSLGLMALDGLPSLQASVAGGAMGYRGDVPALCRATGNAA